MTAKPHFPDVGVIGLVPDSWGGPWMPRHQVLTRLARYFHVVWVDPAKGWRDLWLGRSGDRLAGMVNPAEFDLPGFSIYRPGRLLPRLYRPAALASTMDRFRLAQARRLLTGRRCKTIIVYLWRPEFGGSLSRVRHDLSCYHIDDEYSFSEVEQPLASEEARVIGQVDEVFIHSPALLAKKGGLNRHTSYVPNGVDFDAYSTPQEEPEDLRRIPRPRAGYVGVIKRQLDFALLLQLARRRDDLSFVMVGPRGFVGDSAGLVDELARLPNVHFLGGKPIEALPAYTQHVDACMMCYAVNDYTKYIYPLKLHEYLATGRPVVAAPIRTLRDFGGVISLAGDADEWSAALSAALRPESNTEEMIDKRQEVARSHDWERLVARIAYSLSRKLAPVIRTRLQEIAARDLGMAPEDLEPQNPQAP